MTPRAPLFLLLLASTAACAAHDDGTENASSEVTSEDRFSPYPYEMRAITKLDDLAPKNVQIVDPANVVRDQGRIASCASHGFLGMLENQLYVERGITTDFSERFQLYANFMESGTLGGDPKVIARFPEIAADWGLLAESAYPYTALAPNAGRFTQDAAQGLAGDPNAVMVDAAIAGTKPASRARSDILQKPEFLGQLPAGPYPVTIPLDATFTDDARVPEVELDGKIYACFAKGGAASVPPEKRLALTPREVVHKCLDFDPKQYFSCALDLDALAKDAEARAGDGDECAKARAVADGVGAEMAKRGAAWLELTMRLLDRGQSVEVGVKAPKNWGTLSVWFGKGLAWGGGHAVLAVGYLTYEELGRVEEQSRGMLASGLFDELAGAVEPEFEAKRASGGLPTDPAQLRDARLATKLGKLMKDEGGLLLFRNSWGEKAGDVTIGVRGYQSMTFDFFLKSLMLVESRTNRYAAGVAWPAEGEPAACPAVAAPSDPWLAADHGASVGAFLRGVIVPTACQP